MRPQYFVGCVIALAVGVLGQSARAQDGSLDLTMRFDFVTDAPTAQDPVKVKIGFDDGSIGVPVGSQVLSNVVVEGDRVLVSILVEPPPPSEISLPAEFFLNPIVDLGVLRPGEYQLEVDMGGQTGTSRFVVIPEPSTACLGALACLAMANVNRRRRRPLRRRLH